jgi:hypothetical protein
MKRSFSCILAMLLSKEFMARCLFGLSKKSIQQYLNQKIHQPIEKGKDKIDF